MGKITTEHLDWHYKSFGFGPNTLIAFHGIGQRPEDWEVLLPFLSVKYTIIAFYLPHHGPAEWDYFQLNPEHFQAFNEEIKPLLKGHTAIIGHSIGARLALSLFLQPNCPYQSLVLTAPDGIRDSLIYRFATRSKLGRRCMKVFTKHPNWIMNIASILKKANVIPSGLLRFIDGQYNTIEKAERIRKTWRALSWPSFSPTRMNQKIDEGKEVIAYFGKHDKVIKPWIGYKLGKQVKAKVVMLDKGHNLLHGDRLGLMLQEALGK